MSDEIDWSVDDSGYDTAGQELDNYLQSGGQSAGDSVADDGTTTGINDQISNLGSGVFSGLDLAKLFSDSKAFSGIAKILGAAGAGKLADKLFGVTGGPGGYQGGIPTLTASREMLPIPTTQMDAAGKPALDEKGQPIARRPGSGGVTYFTPMVYKAGGGMLDYAQGGIADLGGYSDGGRLLKGPGDGVSDSIPAMIGRRQPARLADGEFVIPARIVSELGNGSTEAGARKLYAMMDRIKKARSKAKNIAADTKADKHLPA